MRVIEELKDLLYGVSESGKRSEADVAKAMKGKGYNFALDVKGHDSLFSKTIRQASDLVKTDLKGMSVKVIPIDKYIAKVELQNGTKEQDFDTAMKKFMVGAQKKVDEYMSKYPDLPYKVVLSMDKGGRYIRVVKTHVESGGKEIPHSKSVYCFIDKTNGNVLKAAGWKAPAKHARGNIFNKDNGLGGVSAFGGVYLR